MKKRTLHNIFFTGLGVLFLLVLIFSVREIVLLNRIVKTEKEVRILLNERRIIDKISALHNSEKNLVKNIVISEDEKEIDNFLKEHNQNVNMFLKRKEELLLFMSEKNEIPNKAQSIKLTESISETFKNETDPLIKSLIREKEKIFEINIYERSKEEYLNALLNNLLVIQDQIKESSEIITGNLQSLQKIIDKNETDKREEKAEFIRTAEKSVFIFFAVIILLSALLFAYSSKYFFKPLNEIQNFISRLTTGELPENLHLKAGKEPVMIATSLNKIVVNLKEAVKFSGALSERNFTLEFKPSGDNDLLGNTLLMLKESLLKSEEEESLRKEEELQRQKTNEGLTMFAEILRQHSENIQQLADKVISSLVNFMNANQGALFFLNDENPENIFYELIGAYAYNRKKFLSKEIKPGEGLIGAVAIEKYTVYMTEVPEDYINIESGTGSANPRSILIVPLKIEDRVLGVIELASFNEFKKEEVATVEKIAESIASSLSNAKINMETSKLNEQFRERVKLLQQTEDELNDSLVKIKELTQKITRLERENNKLKKIIES